MSTALDEFGVSGLRVSGALVIPEHELVIRTSRSGGPGGQNVNKVETRVELAFDIVHSSCLTDEQKRILVERLGSRVSSTGILRVAASESRSQWSNRLHAKKKLAELLQRALRPRRKRVATKPSAQSREKRLLSKKRRGETKRLRGRPEE